MHNLHSKKIGIWGFGIVGKAAFNYLIDKTKNLSVIDSHSLSEADKSELKKHGTSWYLQEDYLQQFLIENDYILASPGIDLRPYHAYKEKWITELDLVHTYWSAQKPIIGITGSVGKTTVTSLLAQIFGNNNIPIYCGGNIGQGMLSMINEQDRYHGALLELSSFQLEQIKEFSPTLAIWTNFYPNHLDRHGTIDDYFQAKYKLLTYQQPHQHALVPWLVYDKIKQNRHKQTIHICMIEKPTARFLALWQQDGSLFFIENNIIMEYRGGNTIPLLALEELPNLTFPENFLTIVAALSIAHNYLNFPNLIPTLPKLKEQTTLLEHRLEKVATIAQVDYYNDSKSTTPASTLAAITQLQKNKKPIVLIVGGLSKGINRADFIANLKNRVKAIYCFGKEASLLHKLCLQNNLVSYEFSHLNDAFNAIIKNVSPQDQILFSPAGSSFDLFQNYQERGTCFKKLVVNLLKNN